VCGVAGVVDLIGEREIEPGRIKAMTDALAHRGPDGEGFWSEPGCALGHRRLAIIDIEGGAQPFVSRDGRAVLSFNGEIYNHRALAADLARSGPPMRTRCDTEVLVEKIARRGAGALPSLTGMFAFAAWLPEARELVLARDRLGERPLYYAVAEDGWCVFASEIDAVLASGLVPDELDLEAVADYFAYGYVPDPKSVIAGVRKLPPGATLRLRRGAPVPGPAPETYWRPRFDGSRDVDLEDAREELRERLDAAVQSQMMSDVPLGAFLSGGVDSSAVIWSMAHGSTAPVLACTIGFDEASHDERDYARLMAERVGARRVEEVVRLDAGDMIDEVAAIYGEPFADTSALPTVAVCRVARREVTVALSGDGGDEVFAGYRRYPFFAAEERLRSAAPEALRRALFAPAAALYPKLDWAPRMFRAKSTLLSLAEDRVHGYFRSAASSAPELAGALLSADVRWSLGGYDPANVIADAFAEADTDDPVSAAQYVDMRTWLPGRMLTKVDRASMAASLEVRPPILDHGLVEWAGALPSRLKLAGGEGKRVLKAAMRGRVPDAILDRPKRGFDAPVSRWMRDAPDAIRDRTTNSDALRTSGLIDMDAAERLVRRHARGEGDHAQEIWALVMFDAFLRKRAR